MDMRYGYAIWTIQLLEILNESSLANSTENNTQGTKRQFYRLTQNFVNIVRDSWINFVNKTRNL